MALFIKAQRVIDGYEMHIGEARVHAPRQCVDSRMKEQQNITIYHKDYRRNH